MGRYEPTAEEQAAIDLLTLSGHVVLRRRSYDALRERVRVAEALLEWEREAVKAGDRWGAQLSDERRRIEGRLTAVVAAAAAQGVTIQAINAALSKEAPDA